MRHTEAALVEALGSVRGRVARLTADLAATRRAHDSMQESLDLAGRKLGVAIMDRDEAKREAARLRGEAARLSVDLENRTKERDAARADARRLGAAPVTQ